MTYGPSNGWLDGHPAVMTRPIAKGSITYIGGLLEPNLMKAAAKWIVQSSNVEPEFPAPDGIEMCKRSDNTHAVYVLINFNHSTVNVPLPRAMEDILNNRLEVTNMTLAPRGVAVLSSR